VLFWKILQLEESGDRKTLKGEKMYGKKTSKRRDARGRTGKSRW